MLGVSALWGPLFGCSCRISAKVGLHSKCVCVLVTQSCPTPLQPHGLQLTRLLCPWNFLEWVAISFSRRSFQPKDQTHWGPKPLHKGFMEYWSGLPFPSPGDLPDPRIKLTGAQNPYIKVWGAGGSWGAGWAGSAVPPESFWKPGHIPDGQKLMKGKVGC